MGSTRITAVLGLLCCLLAGCASPRYDIDESRASVLIVRGYIEGGSLNRWGPCYELEVGVCGSGLPSDVTFVVEDALVGAAARKHLRAHLHYTQSWPDLELGRGAQYLAVILSDGGSNRIYGVVSVVRTADGKWAVPVPYEGDEPKFPCSRADISPTRLQFEPPGPRQSFAELEYDWRDAENLQEDDSFTVKDGYVYANTGLSLDHASALYAGKSAEAVAGACEY